MNLKRFFSTNSRDAIKQVRAELGEQAMILSNRKVDGGVEVIASAEGDLAALIGRPIESKPARQAAAPAPAEMTTMMRVAQATQQKLAKRGNAAANDSANADSGLPVSESFASYVMRNEKNRVGAASATAEVSSPSPAALPQDPGLREEILQMKAILQEQVGALNWRDTLSRRPLQAKIVSRLLGAGFSPLLARTLSEKLPADFNEKQAGAWLQDSLIRNVSVAAAGDDMIDRGGVFALLGPTGVGKTTTAAKLAARCVVKFGAKSLGLITIDSYRVGAEDQLRAYGKILGVTVHTARDAQSLADLIALMRDRHLVLIDTVGMGQRDSRLGELMQMLKSPAIEPVLFLNASAQAETLDDVVRCYGGPRPRQGRKVIVSKLDEAVKYGFVLDCAIRHKLSIQCLTNGQRVPEDLHPANAQYLVHRALRPQAAQAFALPDADIPLVLSTTGAGAKSAARAGRV